MARATPPAAATWQSKSCNVPLVGLAGAKTLWGANLAAQYSIQSYEHHGSSTAAWVTRSSVIFRCVNVKRRDSVGGLPGSLATRG